MSILSSEPKRCGYVAIVGRPNVGKSTLLNHILGQKLAITSRKPQTTRHNMLGIKTLDDAQTIYVDTPGIHKNDSKAINRYMNRSAKAMIDDVDILVFVVEKMQWTAEDELVLESLKQARVPVILVVNKIDQIDEKQQLLPYLDTLNKKMDFKHVVPLSALQNNNIEALEASIAELLPESVHFFPEDQITDRTERFIVAEIVREKIMRQLGHELPYQIAVEIEAFQETDKLIEISALILVERDGQKNIVIGKSGEKIKTIGREARMDMERLLAKKVMLNLWVKVKSGWSDDERALKSLGYNEF